VSDRIVVQKIGGSILSGDATFALAAQSIQARLDACPDERLLVVVSAESGVTDALLSRARGLSADPDPAALDLLWSTGELASVALLTLALQRIGVRAAGLNVHQTGLHRASSSSRTEFRPLRLRALLAAHHVVIVPGFLACTPGGAVASLGRGGSDLTAVLLAIGLDAARCELVKDVPGYFTSDPNVDTEAQPIDRLDYARALAMAAAGCELVQPAAIEAAHAAGLPIVVRSLNASTGTLLSADATAVPEPADSDAVTV
jgi:aspartate kinase